MSESLITSTANPLVKELAALGSRRARTETGTFLVEGGREVGRAIGAGLELLDLIICDELLAGPPPAVSGARTHQMAEAPFRKLSRRQNPDGVAARIRTPRLDLDFITLGPDALVLVAEAIEKPGNIGAMLRTAESLGVDAVVLADPETDVFNPNTIRASQGAIFTVTVGVGSADRVLEWLEGAGIAIVAGDPGGHAAPWEVDLTSSCALVVGAEAEGLSDVWRGRARLVTIPMTASTGVDSLNTAMSAALLMYEAVRQRSTR